MGGLAAGNKVILSLSGFGSLAFEVLVLSLWETPWAPGYSLGKDPKMNQLCYTHSDPTPCSSLAVEIYTSPANKLSCLPVSWSLMEPIALKSQSTSTVDSSIAWRVCVLTLDRFYRCPLQLVPANKYLCFPSPYGAKVPCWELLSPQRRVG